MDKLRACIVANYYANAGITKHPEVKSYIFIFRQLSAAPRQRCSTVAATTVSSVS